MSALDEIRILDLTWGMAGPAGILLLAEHGADVVKVEPPGGDPYRDYSGYRVWNRSRRSVALDLKTADGKEQFLDLVGNSRRPGRELPPRSHGGPRARLRRRWPRASHTSSTARCRPIRPTADMPAAPGWDALVQARSGQQFEQQAWRPGPAFLGSPLPSIATSTWYRRRSSPPCTPGP